MAVQIPWRQARYDIEASRHPRDARALPGRRAGFGIARPSCRRGRGRSQSTTPIDTHTTAPDACYMLSAVDTCVHWCKLCRHDKLDCVYRGSKSATTAQLPIAQLASTTRPSWSAWFGWFASVHCGLCMPYALPELHHASSCFDFEGSASLLTLQ